MLNLLLKHIAQKKNLHLEGDASLRSLISLMHINESGVVVILKGRQPAGVITERDVVELLSRGTDLDGPVKNHMRKRLITTRGDRTVGYALNLTIENNIRRVVVTDDDNNFIGVITQQELLKYLEEDFYRLAVQVRHVLKQERDLIGAGPDDTVRDLMMKMVQHKISAVPVLKEGIAVGIVSEKDIIRLSDGNFSFDERIDRFMTSPVETASMDAPLVEVVEQMNVKNVRRVVVIDRDGKAMDVLTLRDIVQNLEDDYAHFLEKKLKNAKEILNLFPEMLIEIADTGTDQLIIWANDRVINQFGGEILDNPVTEFIPRKYWDKIYSTISRHNRIENIKIRKQERIYEISGFLIATDGKMEKRRLQLILRDITEDIKLSTVDPLSGLYNKRFMNEFLMKEIERSRRLNKQFSIVICDLDDFKQINDTYGHLSGDMVIRSFAQRMKNSIRNLDVAGRYGGDEFIIILPEASRETAYSIMERLRQHIEKDSIRVAKGSVVRVTASFGIATFPADGMSSDDLIIVSDERLYKAKNLGKNKIACT
jgi:diguanylate cyclase (GGDEF)-like protein